MFKTKLLCYMLMGVWRFQNIEWWGGGGGGVGGVEKDLIINGWVMGGGDPLQSNFGVRKDT